MGITIYVAIYGAVISTIALGWNIYKQVTSGPKLVGSVIPEPNKFVAPLRGATACVDLVVANRGTTETNISKVEVLCHKSRIDRRNYRYVRQAAITLLLPKYDLPYKISPGDEFRCRLDQDAEVADWVKKYRSYFSVTHSMSSRPVHFRLKPFANAPGQATP